MRITYAAVLGALLIPLLAGCAEVTASEPTDISAVRKKYPQPIDLANARAECMRERGWDVSVDDDGQIHADFPADQGDAYGNDSTDCLTSLGIDPEAPTPEKTLDSVYPTYVEGADCLRKAGWEISTTPTLATFKDTYETQPWYPWSEIPPQEWDGAKKLCPSPGPTY